MPLHAVAPAPAERRTSTRPQEAHRPSPAAKAAPADPPKRSRGRPAIGPATKIRLADDQEEFATRLGQGNLAEGVRRALDFTRENLPGEGRVPATPEQASFIASAELLEEIKEIGKGSVNRGLTALVKAARVLTPEGIRKLGRS